jgi:tetratricopeptide (TPR) repeat protein
MQKPFRLFSSLPWIIALAALGLYLATLNTFVSLSSLQSANEVAGWEPYSQTARPLLWLLTRPVSMLGGSFQFLAMNLFSAVLAALTLAQLVRTVSILPHDRTRDQRNRESHEKGLLSIPLAWAPPLVAAMVCAFQLKFWEHATVLTGEMLDLLVFAFCIRCLMEYRLNGKDRWLNCLALAYGIGVTNNAAMIAFFPLFLASLIWIRGIKFFQFPFLARMTLYGVAGLSLYLLLPVVAAVKGADGVTFWAALKANLATQRQTILLPFTSITVLRLRLILMSMTSLVPLILIGFRWPSLTTETSSIGRNLLAVLFVVAGTVFVAAGIAGSFALPFGPFELGYRLFPYLTFYYLTALTVGYFLGYVLLVLLTDPESRWQRSKPAGRVIAKTAGYLVLVAALVSPVVLAVQSARSIDFTNGPSLLRTLTAKLDSLPVNPSALLSDDGSRLILLQAALQQAGKTRNDVLLDTSALKFTNVIAKLSRKYPALAGVWPTNAGPGGVFDDIPVLTSILELQKRMPVFYLHPSFGYYFEAFHSVPHGGVYEMVPYTEGQLLPPPISDATIVSTSAYWDKVNDDVLRLLLPMQDLSNVDAGYLKQIFSRELTDWGVTLQKHGKLKEAQVALEVAVALHPANPLDAENPGNPVAEATLAFNKHLQNSGSPVPAPSPSWKGIIDDPASLQTAVNAFGPMDEPLGLARFGSVLAPGNNLRQSLIHLSRALELDPANVEVQIAVSMTRLDLKQPDESLKIVRAIRDSDAKITGGQKAMLINVESLALASKGNVSAGETLLKNALAKDRNNIALEKLLTDYYLKTGQLERAIKEIDQRIALDPKNESALLDKAALLIAAERFPEALAPLEKVLTTNPQSQPAIQNRAFALLRLKRFAEAKAEYEHLLKVADKPVYQAYMGLSGVALFQNDTKERIKQIELYLANAPRGTTEYGLMKAQLSELKKSL